MNSFRVANKCHTLWHLLLRFSDGSPIEIRMKTSMDTSNFKTETDFRRWLQTELTDRCQKNPRYSLRAFAALLQIEASSVSQILSGKRNVSAKMINVICDRLSATPAQRMAFLKKSSKGTISSEAIQAHLLALDAFSVISDWYHYAILELTQVKKFQSKPAWIARCLGISVSEVKIAVERLTRLELLIERDQKYIRCEGLLTNFVPGVSSAGLKNLQRQVIGKALDAVDNCLQEEKDITSITMAIDPTKLPEARKRISQFRRELCAFLQEGEQTRVYNLGLQLYPISRNIEKGEDDQ